MRIFIVQLLLLFSASGQAQLNLDAASNIASLVASNVAANMITGGSPSAGLQTSMTPVEIHKVILKVLKQMTKAAEDSSASDPAAAEPIADAKASFLAAVSSLVEGSPGDDGSSAASQPPPATTQEGGAPTAGSETPPENAEAPPSSGPPPSAPAPPDSAPPPDDGGPLITLAKVGKKGKTTLLEPLKSILSQVLFSAFGNDTESERSLKNRV